MLADLVPTQQERRTQSATVPTEWFTWLPLRCVDLLGTDRPPVEQLTLQPQRTATRLEALQPTVPIDRELADRLAALDQVRPDVDVLRLGWLWVAGTTAGPDGPQPVLHPLVTTTVRARRGLPASLVRIGDVELSPLIDDPDIGLAHIPLGGGAFDALGPAAPQALLDRMPKLTRFALDAAAAAGFAVDDTVGPVAGPAEVLALEGLRVVIGLAVFAVNPAMQTGRATTIRQWASGDLGVRTAFHELYLPDETAAPGGPTAADDPSIESPYPLTPTQRVAVARTRTAPVTVLSGAPGTGKSQTVAAIACDAVARGETVLVSAKSGATVDALMDLFAKAPGPEPVVFGSNERRAELAMRLSAGEIRPARAEDVASARRRRDAALAQRGELADAMTVDLLADAIRAGARGAVDELSVLAPGALDGADLDTVEALLDHAELDDADGGWFARRRARRARRRAASLLGAGEAVTPSILRGVIATARAARAALVPDVRRPDGRQAEWAALAQATDAARHAVGDWMALEAVAPDRLDRSALAALGSALRAGRGSRRAQLVRLARTHITRSLPLWVGTLGDIDELLPPTPAMFDLVLLDEASAIDQALAATALLRGRRAVIVGDPRQLRHVSFHGRDQIDAALVANGVPVDDPMAMRLDLRRNSVFDLGAGAGAVLELDEHFRSAPPLVKPVFDRLYDGRVRLATRSPATEALDVVEVVRVAGERDDGRVVGAEVDAVLRVLGELHGAGATSVGVISPFRAQAEALEARILTDLHVDVIEDLGLRVGTVHGMQGNERDTIVLSPGAGDGGTSQAWRFVDDPHLAAVMLTRARRQIIVVLAGSPPADGMLATYLRLDDRSSSPRPRPRERSSGDAARDAADAALAEQLRRAEVGAVAGYPVGRHRVDICVGDASGFVGVVTSGHPAGPAAHIERHLELARAGWTLLEAPPGSWEGRHGELVVELTSAAVRHGVSMRTPPTADAAP